MQPAPIPSLSRKLPAAVAYAFMLVAAVGLFLALNQPPVIGEVSAGILLGPSLLGRLSPELSAWLLPQSVAPHLSLIAQLGVILYMYQVGLELNSELLRHRA